MQSLSAEEIEARAQAIVAAYGKPRRRERRRVAEGLRSAPQQAVPALDGHVAAWRAGEGPAVLLVHGWEDDNSLWTPMIERLLARGRAVVAFDLPGHGLSEAEAPSLPNIATAIGNVADRLGPVNAIVAHSLGCSATALALDQGLAVDTVVLIGPPLPTRPELQQQRKRRSWMREDMPQALTARIKELLDARARAAPVQFDPEETARRMRARALFVHGTEDEMYPVQASRYIAAQWPGAQLWEPEGLGHRQTARDSAVIARILAFLDEAP